MVERLARVGSLRLGRVGQIRPTTAGLPRINWSHPLAQGLLFYGYDNGAGVGWNNSSGNGSALSQAVCDLVSDASAYRMGTLTFTTPAVTGTPYGPAFTYDTNNSCNFAASTAIQAATAAGGYTYACAFIKTGSVGQYSRPFGRTANNGASSPFVNWDFEINPGSTGQGNIVANVNNAGGLSTTPNGSISDNQYTTAVGKLSGSTLSLYLNGAFATSTSGITAGSANSQDAIMFGGSSTAGISNPFAGVVFYGALWNRVLSDQEIQLLHTDPYCFLLPENAELATFDPIPPPAPAMTIDGSATGQISLSTTSSVTLTTTQPNDLIVIIAYAEQSSGPAITGIAGGGLTFTQRARSNASARGSMEIWWAVAPTVLSAVTFNVTYAAAVDDATVLAFGVTGANTTAPFDSNASLPAKQSSASASWTPGFTGISTTSANALLIFAVGTATVWSPPGTVPSGFSVLGSVSNGGGSQFAEFGAAYQIVTASQSGIAPTWGSSINAGNNGGEAIFDAIVAAAPAVAFTTWSTTDLVNMTLSGGNLVATPTASGNAYVRGQDPKRSGKYYFEYTSTTAQGGSSNFGLAPGGTTLGTTNGAAYVNASSGSILGFNRVTNAQTSFASLGAIGAGTVVGVAIDLDNRRAWFREGAAGNWNASSTANPATGAGGIDLSAIGLGAGIDVYPYASMSATSQSVTANFGGSAFTGAVPAGFTAGWDNAVAALSNMVLTQAGAEAWLQGSPVLQLTQAGTEVWASVAAAAPPASHTQPTLTIIT